LIRHLTDFVRGAAGRATKPAHVTLFVTGRCEFRCKTCFYAHHLNEGEAELSLDVYRALAPQLRGVLWCAFCGGEPFLREDLADIIEVTLRDAKPAYANLVTNGFYPDRVEAVLRRAIAARGRTTLSVSVSLDGVGDLHDDIRGMPGSFERALETLRVLKRLRDQLGQPLILVPTCYNALNQDRIEEIPEFLEREVGDVAWDFCLVRGTPRSTDSTRALDLDRYYELRRRHCSGVPDAARPSWTQRFIAAKNHTLVDIHERAVRDRSSPLRCRAGELSIVIREQGDVVACELEEYPMGNLEAFDGDLGALLRSPQARRTRQRIRTSGCTCAHETNLTTNLLFSTGAAAKLATTLVTGARPRFLGGVHKRR
jgi:MoaA/NifB/PqqE/SkfB family radical SAM enzyme